MEKIQELEQRITEIEKRNIKVETDKKWEGSVTRKTLLIIFTYISVFLYFIIIDVENPSLNAIVPSLGFLLSTLTLPIFKNIWIEFQTRKK